MARRSLLIIFFGSFLFGAGCTLETEKEEVRVVYYAGFPSKQINEYFPHLKISVNAPHELTLSWKKDYPGIYARYGLIDETVDCNSGERANATPEKSIRLENLRVHSEYVGALCQDGTDIQYRFQFETPKYNIMTLQQWCDYPRKATSLAEGFKILKELKGISSCEQLFNEQLPKSVEYRNENKDPITIDLYPISEQARNSESLVLHRVQLVALDPLDKLKNLRSLQFDQVELPRETSIADLAFLESLQQIEELKITDFGAALLVDQQLQGLQNLRSLELSSASVVTLSPQAFSQLRLKRLSIGNGFLPSLDAIEGIEQLESLSIRRSRLSTLQGIEKFTQLESLDVSENELSQVTKLSQLTQLTSLRLAENPIDDLTPLLSLKRLELLDVRNTLLPTASIFRPLEDETLDAFYFSGTPAFSNETCPFRQIEICQDFVSPGVQR